MERPILDPAPMQNGTTSKARRRLDMLASVLTLVALLLVTAGEVMAAGPDMTAAAPKSVLLLSSERSDFPAVSEFEKGLRDGLASPTAPVQFFVEHFDFGRFPQADYGMALLRNLQERYAGRRIDLIVTFADEAFEFVLAHRAALLPDVPVIGAGMERQNVAKRRLPAGITSVPVAFDYRNTLKLALALQPDAREVVLVHGLSDFDLRRRDEARRAIEEFTPRLTYRTLAGMRLAEMEAAVRGLSSSSLVLLLSMVRDAEGRPLVGADYAGRLSAASTVPVYSTFGSHMRRGTLAGAITDWTGLGLATANVAVSSLAGRHPADPITIEPFAPPLHVNWTALGKWGIPASRIPRDAQILFRKPGLWDEYRGFVLAALAAVILQGLLIMGLLLQSQRRRRMELELRESEERVRLAADAAHLGIWGWVASNEHMWVTDNCRVLHALPRNADISFQTFTDAVHPEDRARLRETVDDALRKQRPFMAEYRVLLSTGEVRWITSRGRGTYGAAAAPLRVTGVSADVTQRKRAEETLRLAVEALPIAIVMIDRQGTIVLANTQAARLLGYEPQELVGQSVDTLVPDRYRNGHAGFRAGYFAEPRVRPMAANRDLWARRKDGSELPVEIGLNPIRSGEDLLVLAAIVDLTSRHELKRKQQELEHITRVSSLGEITASLAHELSQPLAAILSNAQAGLRYLARGDADLAEIREILEDVVADDKRAGEVIGALRAMLRRERTEIVPVDVTQAVRDVLSLLHSELVGQHIEVDTSFEADCFVLASKTQLEQVLLNLVMNSIDALRPQPPTARRLRIEASVVAGPSVRIAIRDSGIGIPADELDKVFEAFWTTKSTGMGMGLAVCSSIVKSLGGDIRVEPNTDQGVTFFMTLPHLPQPGHGS